MKMGRAKPLHTRSVYKPVENTEYDFCGCCPTGLVVYPESIEDVLETNCHYAFRENFEMFLRKQYDKNIETDMQIQLKHEQRMSFADMTAKIGKGAKCFECKGPYENQAKEKSGAYCLAMAGRKFTNSPDRSNYYWPDGLLDGFDKADALITHLKDLDKKFGHMKLKDLSNDCVKAVKKDLVVSGYRWVVEWLDAALEEFKKFRDGLDENERKKWNKSVVQQSVKWSDFECGEFEDTDDEFGRLEEVNSIIKGLHKEMDDILARYNNLNKDIDSLVELIEGKSLGAVPKKMKENSSKSRKKKKERARKDGIKHVDEENEGNVNSQLSEEKVEQFQFDALSERSNLSENSSKGEKEKGSNQELLAEQAMEKEKVSFSDKKIDKDIIQKLLVTELEKIDKDTMQKFVVTEVDKTDGKKIQVDEIQKDNAVNGQILIHAVQKHKKRDKESKPKCARESCPNKGRHKCSRCMAVFYCAQDCLNEDWPHHKMFCDYVFKANKVPHHETSSGGREEVE